MDITTNSNKNSNLNKLYMYMDEESKEILKTLLSMNELLSNEIHYSNTIRHDLSKNMIILYSYNINILILNHIFDIRFKVNNCYNIYSINVRYKDKIIMNVDITNNKDLANVLEEIINIYIEIERRKNG